MYWSTFLSAFYFKIVYYIHLLSAVCSIRVFERLFQIIDLALPFLHCSIIGCKYKTTGLGV